MNASPRPLTFQPGATAPSRTIAAIELRRQGAQCLATILDRTPSIRFACLATSDGRLVARAGDTGNAGNAQGIAAMSSSLLALSEAYSREMLGTECHYSATVTSEGTIVTVRIPRSQGRLALSVAADATDVMGTVLRRALDASEELADIQQGIHASCA